MGKLKEKVSKLFIEFTLIVLALMIYFDLSNLSTSGLKRTCFLKNITIRKNVVVGDYIYSMMMKMMFIILKKIVSNY